MMGSDLAKPYDLEPGHAVNPLSWFRNRKLRPRVCVSYCRRAISALWAALGKVDWSGLGRHVKDLLPFLGFAAIGLMTVQVVGFGNSALPLVVAVALALFVSALFWFIPRRTFVSLFVNTFGWLPVTLGSVSYFFWVSYAPSESPDAIFFHASADVLPVLLLAAVVDVRRSETLESRGLVLPIIAVFLGEVAALNALAFGYTTAEDFAAVAASLVSTTFALVLAVMADLPESSRDKNSEESSSDKAPEEIVLVTAEQAIESERPSPPPEDREQLK